MRTFRTVNRVDLPVPVIPIQGRTLLRYEKGGSILKFEAPNLLIFSSERVFKLVRHHEKTIKKPWQFKYYPKGKNGVVWACQGFKRSVKNPRFEAGLPARPVRGREGLAALAIRMADLPIKL